MKFLKKSINFITLFLYNTFIIKNKKISSLKTLKNLIKTLKKRIFKKIKFFYIYKNYVRNNLKIRFFRIIPLNVNRFLI